MKSSNTYSGSIKEYGMSVIFLLISIFLFGTGLAIAIDLALYLSALTRAQSVADQAALASLERQLTAIKNGGDAPRDRLNEARKEAAHISEFNAVMAEVHGSGENYIDLFTGAVTPGRSRLIPGRYVWSDVEQARAVDAGATACDNGNQFPLFCGFPDFGSANNDQLGVNAMRIEGELHTPLIKRFSYILGYENFPIRVFSTAFREPVELYFVVDRSGSMGEESFYRVDEDGGGSYNPAIRAALPAFLLGQGCDAGFPANRPTNLNTCALDDITAASSNPHEKMYRRLKTNGTRRNDKEHFSTSDYIEDVGAFADTEWTNRADFHPSEGFYTSDGYFGPLMVRKIEGNYQGPKPFDQLLGGFFSLISELREGNMAGNRVGTLFFGGEVLEPPVLAPFDNPFGWSQIIHSLPTERLCYIENLLCDSVVDCGNANSVCPNGDSVLDRGITSSIQAKLLKLGLYPTLAENTDAYYGIAQAYLELQLTRLRGIRTNQKIIFVSGDGLANCTHDGGVGHDCIGWQLWDFNGNGTVDAPDKAACEACAVAGWVPPHCAFFLANPGLNAEPGTSSRACKAYNSWFGCPRLGHPQEYLDTSTASCINTLQRHRLAMGEIRNLAGYITAQGISISAILSSQSIGVNVLDIGDSSGKCLTQDEAHRQRKWYTSDHTPGCERTPEDDNTCRFVFHNRSAANPYRKVVRAWELVTAISGGKIYPILPSDNCTPRGPNDCPTDGSTAIRTKDPQCRPSSVQWADIMVELLQSSRYMLAPRR